MYLGKDFVTTKCGVTNQKLIISSRIHIRTIGKSQSI